MKRSVMNQKGQGTTEYIVILAIVVGLAVTIFWGQIRGVLNPKISTIATQIATAGD